MHLSCLVYVGKFTSYLSDKKSLGTDEIGIMIENFHISFGKMKEQD